MTTPAEMAELLNLASNASGRVAASVRRSVEHCERFPWLYCTKEVDHPAASVLASQLLLVRDTGERWVAFGRCSLHDAVHDVMIIKMCWPDQPWMIIDLAPVPGQDPPAESAMSDAGGSQHPPGHGPGAGGQDQPA